MTYQISWNTSKKVLVKLEQLLGAQNVLTLNAHTRSKRALPFFTVHTFKSVQLGRSKKRFFFQTKSTRKVAANLLSFSIRSSINFCYSWKEYFHIEVNQLHCESVSGMKKVYSRISKIYLVRLFLSNKVYRRLKFQGIFP